MALNAHIAQRALKSPDFALDDPAQFSFVLGLVIFAEKLGYVSELPGDWKARVRPEWHPLFKLALDRFDALQSTGDVLQLGARPEGARGVIAQAQGEAQGEEPATARRAGRRE